MFLQFNQTKLKVTELFFDRAHVVNELDKTTRRVLSRFGAYVRNSAKWSIRTKDGPSPPGQPPHSHTGLLRKFIFFYYERMNQNVVIGPTLLPWTRQAPRPTVPEVLEYGGRTTRQYWSKKDKRGRRKLKTKEVHIRPRPYMNPAFEKQETKLPAMWRDALNRN